MVTRVSAELCAVVVVLCDMHFSCRWHKIAYLITCDLHIRIWQSHWWHQSQRKPSRNYCKVAVGEKYHIVFPFQDLPRHICALTFARHHKYRLFSLSVPNTSPLSRWVRGQGLHAMGTHTHIVAIIIPQFIATVDPRGVRKHKGVSPGDCSPGSETMQWNSKCVSQSGSCSLAAPRRTLACRAARPSERRQAIARRRRAATCRRQGKQHPNVSSNRDTAPSKRSRS